MYAYKKGNFYKLDELYEEGNVSLEDIENIKVAFDESMENHTALYVFDVIK